MEVGPFDVGRIFGIIMAPRSLPSLDGGVDLEAGLQLVSLSPALAYSGRAL